MPVGGRFSRLSPIIQRLRKLGSTWPIGSAIIPWIVIGWVVAFRRLGYTALLDPDEAHYAQLTREMAQSKSWFVPLLDGTPFVDKPVLFHWLQALSVKIFGESELAIRMPSAVAAVCLIAITWWLARRLFGAGVGQLAAMMFATLPATFALASVGVFDMVFATFLFGGIACLLISSIERRERLQYGGYALLTLAVMTKGPVSLVLVVLLFAVACAVSREARVTISRLHWGFGLALIIFASSPWFAWMWVKFGDRFVRDYVFAGNVWYFTSPPRFSRRASDHAFYLRTFLGAFFPWSLIALGGGLDEAVARLKGKPSTTPVIWLWIWMATIVGFFSVARFKLDTYIFPAAPACAILAALAWHRSASDPTQRWTRAAVMLVAGIMTAGGALAAAALFRIDLGLDRRSALLPAVLAAGGAALLIQMYRRRWAVPASATALVLTLVAAFAVVVQLGFPLLESSRPTRALGRWVAQHTAAGIAIGTYGLDDWRASIRYYTDRPITHLSTVDDVRAFFANAPTAKVLMLRADYRAMRSAGLDVQEIAARRAIVGRTGKYFRRQIWGRLVVVTRRDYADSLAINQWDLQ